MGNEVTILVKFAGDAETRAKALQERLMQGGPIAQRFGAMAGGALQLIQKHGADAATVLGGIGSVASTIGTKLNSVLEGAASKLIGLAKYAVLAGAAFAGWEIKKGLEYNATLETMSARLGVLYRSQARANEEMGKFREFSARSPFALKDVMEAGRVLDEFNLRSKDWLKTIGDVAAATDAPIGELAHAMTQLVSGREEFALRTFTNIGVNLRGLPGLKWKEEGGREQLQTPGPQAAAVVQQYLAQRFGGMLAAQNATFSGQVHQLMEHIEVARGAVTEKLFAGLREKLTQINAAWDHFMDSPRVQQVMNAISAGLGKAVEYVQALYDRFDQVMGQTGSLGAGLKAALSMVWNDAKPYAIAFLKWLAEAFKEALILAWQGFIHASTGAKLAIGGLAALSLAPTAMSAIAALPAILKVAGAAGRLGGSAIGGIGGAIGGLGTGVEAFGMAGLSAVALPIAAAVAAGLLGRYLIGRWAEGRAGEAERFQQQNSRESVIFHGMKDEEYAKRMGAETTGLQNVLTEAAAAWARLLKIQQDMTAALQKTRDAITATGQALLEKFQAPAEKVSGIEAQIAAQKTIEDAALGRTGDIRSINFQGRVGQEYKANELAGLQAEYNQALQKEVDLRAKALGIEGEMNAKIREGNKSFEERLIGMSGRDRGQMLGSAMYVMGGKTDAERMQRFGALPEAEQKLAAEAPAVRDIAQKWGQNQIARIPGMRGLEKYAPTIEQENARAAGMISDAQARAGLAGPQASDLAGAKSAIERGVQQGAAQLNVKISSDDVHLVVSADAKSREDSDKAIAEVLRRHAMEMQKAVEKAIHDEAPNLLAAAQKQFLAEQDKAHYAGEAQNP